MTVKFGDKGCYLNDLENLRTNLSDFYNSTENCLYCYAVEGSAPVGFLQYKTEVDAFEILTVICPNDEARGMLLEELIKLCNKKGKDIGWRIVSDIGEDGKLTDTSLMKTAEDLGFRVVAVMDILRHTPERLPQVIELVKNLKKMSDWVLSKGYTVCSFLDLSDDARKYICDNPEDEFAGYLHSGKYIKGTAGEFNEKYSFVTLKGDKPVAYTVVRMPSKDKYVFENYCVAKSCRNSGALAPVLYSTINSLIDSGYKIVTFAVYEDNGESFPLLKKRMKDVISVRRIQINFNYFHKEKHIFKGAKSLTLKTR